MQPIFSLIFIFDLLFQQLLIHQFDFQSHLSPTSPRTSICGSENESTIEFAATSCKVANPEQASIQHACEKRGCASIKYKYQTKFRTLNYLLQPVFLFLAIVSHMYTFFFIYTMHSYRYADSIKQYIFANAFGILLCSSICYVFVCIAFGTCYLNWNDVTETFCEQSIQQSVNRVTWLTCKFTSAWAMSVTDRHHFVAYLFFPNEQGKEPTVLCWRQQILYLHRE